MTRHGRSARLPGLAVVVLLVSAVIVVLAPPASAHTPHDSISDVALSPTYAQDGKVFAIAASRLLRGNGDSTWTPSVRGLPRSPESGESLAHITISPTNGNVMYVSSRIGGVFRSDDGGSSWRQAAGGLTRTDILAIAVSPRDPNKVIAAGTLTGLYRTADGGAHWLSIRGFQRVIAIAFVPSTGRVVIGDGSGALAVSDDDGATWQRVASAPSSVTAVAVSPDANNPTVMVGTRDGEFLRSDDGGSTFKQIGSGLPNESVSSIALSPNYARDHVAWLSAAETGVYRTSNGGGTWHRMASGLTTDIQAEQVHVSQYRTIVVSKNVKGSLTLFEGGFDALFRSDDEGAHWYRVETLGDFVVGLAVSPNFARDSTIAVTTYIKGAYLSTNAGEAFERIDNGLSFKISEGNRFAPVKRMHNIVFSPDYASDNTIFSATWTAFLKSTDRGRSWSTIIVDRATSGSVLQQYVIGISPGYKTDHTIFLGTRQGDIYRSENAGAAGSWQRIANVRDRIRSFAFDPAFPKRPTVFVGTANGIVKSADGGRTFIDAKVGPAGENLLAISPEFDRDGTIFAGTAGGLFVSHDRGSTWSLVTLAPRQATGTIEAVALSPDFTRDHTMLVSVGEIGLFRSTDGGKSFAATGSDLVNGNRIISDFTNPTGSPIQFSPAFAQDHTIFAYAQQDVVRSTNGGASWTVLPIPPALDYLRAVDPALLGRYGPTGSTNGASSNGPIALVVGLVVLVGLGITFVARSRRTSRKTVATTVNAD